MSNQTDDGRDQLRLPALLAVIGVSVLIAVGLSTLIFAFLFADSASLDVSGSTLEVEVLEARLNEIQNANDRQLQVLSVAATLIALLSATIIGVNLLSLYSASRQLDREKELLKREFLVSAEAMVNPKIQGVHSYVDAQVGRLELDSISFKGKLEEFIIPTRFALIMLQRDSAKRSSQEGDLTGALIHLEMSITHAMQIDERFTRLLPLLDLQVLLDDHAEEMSKNPSLLDAATRIARILSASPIAEETQVKRIIEIVERLQSRRARESRNA
jgi:hypothetical protein